MTLNLPRSHLVFLGVCVLGGVVTLWNSRHKSPPARPTAEAAKPGWPADPPDRGDRAGSRAREQPPEGDFQQEQSLRVGELVLAMSPFAPREGPRRNSIGEWVPLGPSFQIPDAVDSSAPPVETETGLTAIRLLLEEGANPDGVVLVPESNDEGRALLPTVPNRRQGYVIKLTDFCRTNRLVQTAALLARHAAGDFELVAAAGRGDLPKVQELVPRTLAGTNPDGVLRGALLAAVRHGHVEVARRLVEAGADPLSMGAGQTNALLESVARNDAKLVALLLARVPRPQLPPYFPGTYDRKTKPQDLLARAALEDPQPQLRAGTAAMIKDPAVLTALVAATSDQRVRLLAQAALRSGWESDQARHARAALLSPNRLVRARSVVLVKDEALRAFIARQDPAPSVRRAAVLSLPDGAALADVAAVETDASVSTAAVGRLNDQRGLAKVATQHPDASIRLLAVGKLTDAAALAQAKTDRDFDVRQLAVGRLDAVQRSDPAALAQTAIAADPQAALAAVSMLQDQALLARVATASPHWLVRTTAVERLDDQARLAQLAAEHPDFLIRRLAIRKVSDQRVLARLISAEREPWVRTAGLANLTDPVAAESIASELPLDPVFVPAARAIKPERLRELQQRLRDRARGQPAQASLSP